jgi:hypothetical protein
VDEDDAIQWIVLYLSSATSQKIIYEGESAEAVFEDGASCGRESRHKVLFP